MMTKIVKSRSAGGRNRSMTGRRRAKLGSLLRTDDLTVGRGRVTLVALMVDMEPIPCGHNEGGAEKCSAPEMVGSELVLLEGFLYLLCSIGGAHLSGNDRNRDIVDHAANGRAEVLVEEVLMPRRVGELFRSLMH